MKKLCPLILIFSFALLTACGNQPTAVPPTALPPTTLPPTAAPTPTVDVCSPENIKVGATEINKLMRAFDDAYQIAANLPREQLSSQISKMQDIRRLAQDQAIPQCLLHLKELQITQMNTTINVFLAFLGGADEDSIRQGLAVAGQQHDDYILELARLLGVTAAVLPSPTSAAQAPAEETAPPAIITNPGASPINLHASASMTSATVGALPPGQTAIALGRSQNSEWILIKLDAQPDQPVWIYSSLIQFVSGSFDALPVVELAP